MQGLASRSPQLDSSSCEEMYYPIRHPIQWSAARAEPPRYPHIQLDEEFFSLILQVRKKWLTIFQQHDGVVVDMVEKFLQGFAKRLREERRVEGEGGGG